MNSPKYKKLSLIIPYLFFYFFLMLVETLMRFATQGVFRLPSFAMSFHLLGIAGIYTFFAWCLKPLKWLGALLICFWIVLVPWSQMTYFFIFGKHYSLFTLMNGGQATDFIKEFLSVVSAYGLWTLLYILIFIATFVLLTKIQKVNNLNNQVLLLISGMIFIASMNLSNPSFQTVIKTATPAQSIVPLLGTHGGLWLETTRLINDHIDPSINQQFQVDLEPDDDDPIIIENPIEYHQWELDFNMLAQKANKTVHSQLSQYFEGVRPSEKNDFTGMFEGYNLIFVTAEAFYDVAIDPELTPTLYKMANQGFVFKDFINPIWNVSTLDGEYLNKTSLLPKDGVWSLAMTQKNHMPFVLGNMFNQLQLPSQSRAFHNHTYTYYQRDKSFPNLGYVWKAIGNGLEMTNRWPRSDQEMIELTVNEYINEERFYTYYLTMSGHLLYSFEGNSMARKHQDKVKDLPLSNQAKAYKATQIELDLAMKTLLDKLEENGQAERTVIVIAPDHYPYGLDISTIEELRKTTVASTFERDRSSLIIYSPSMQQPVHVEHSLSSLDILPTVLNLFNLDYDSRLLIGRDVFSPSNHYIYFADRSFENDYGRYDAKTNVFIAKQGRVVSEDQIESFKRHVDQMFYVSAAILDSDYYRFIEENR
jgi:lipoteichoic acid synthase